MKLRIISVKILILSIVLLSAPFIFAANPAQPFLPSDNIQDPNCTPLDSNCYVLLTSFTNESVIGLDYATTTGLLSLTSGYNIPLTASTTEWANSVTTLSTLNTTAIIQDGNSFGNTLTLGTNDNNALSFETNGTTKMTILENGNIGIGTTTPASKIDISSASVAGAGAIRFSGLPATANDLMIIQRDDGTLGFRLQSTGGAQESFRITNAAGTSVFGINTISTGDMFFSNGTGKFGLGTTTPQTMLSLGSGQVGVPLGSVSAPSYSFNGDLDTGIYSSVANAINMVTAGTSRLVISSNGIDSSARVAGLGSAASPIFVGANDTNTGMFSAASDMLGFSTGGTEKLRIDTSGNVGIGTTTPADKLQVFGDVRLGTTGTNGCIKDFAGTGFAGTCSSDERLKTNIVDLSDGYLDKLVNLKVITYNWNEQANTLNKVDTSVINYGLLAQNVESIFPELITTDSSGYKQVNYSRLPLYLLKSVQELSKRVTGIFNGTAKVKVKELCIEDVCVTKDQLQQLLQRQNITPSVYISTTPTPEPIIPAIDTTEPDESTLPEESPTETEPVVEPTPVPVSGPVETPEDVVAPIQSDTI